MQILAPPACPNRRPASLVGFGSRLPASRRSRARDRGLSPGRSPPAPDGRRSSGRSRIATTRSSTFTAKRRSARSEDPGRRRRGTPPRQRHGNRRGDRPAGIYPDQFSRRRRRAKIEVTLADEQTFVAQKSRPIRPPIWPSSRSSPAKVPVIAIGTSSDLMVGETVIAVGNAQGYENTVTHGIVSVAASLGASERHPRLRRSDSNRCRHQSRQLRRPAAEYRRRDDRAQRGRTSRRQGIGFAIPIDRAMARPPSCCRSSGWTAVACGIVAPKRPRPGRRHGGRSVDKESPAAPNRA